jgi:hypothetical protein
VASPPGVIPASVSLSVTVSKRWHCSEVRSQEVKRKTSRPEYSSAAISKVRMKAEYPRSGTPAAASSTSWS